jgi:hypothetical protein
MDDSLIQFIVLMVLAGATALFNWIRKRGQPDEWGDEMDRETPPDSPLDRPRPEKPDWEEELRRLLEGEEAPPKTPPRAPPPIPPPVVVVNRPTPPPVRQQPAPPPLPFPSPRSQPSEWAPEPPEQREIPEAAVPVQSLQEAARAFLRGNQLESKVAAQMHDVGRHAQLRSVTAVPQQTAAEVKRARRWLDDRESLRAAVIASVILGPPKSLEDSPS